jgi:DNA polymerase III subunit epsilon
MLTKLRRALGRMALRDKTYSFLFDPPNTEEVVSLDCETTGFDTRADDIVSLAAIPIKGSKIMTSQAFQAVIKPEAAMGAECIKVHQLRRKDVEHGRSMAEVLPELLRFIGARPLVGYWIEFDVKMLSKHTLRALNVRLPNKQIDVCGLYYDRKYGNAPPGTQIDLRYAAILEDLRLPNLHAHDAFDDALGAAEAYVILNDMKARGAYLKRLGLEQIRTGLAW